LSAGKVLKKDYAKLLVHSRRSLPALIDAARGQHLPHDDDDDDD